MATARLPAGTVVPHQCTYTARGWLPGTAVPVRSARTQATPSKRKDASTRLATPPPATPTPAPAAPKEPAAPPLLSLANPTGAALAFHVLSGASALLALGATATPDALLDFAIPATTAGGQAALASADPWLLRMTGGFLLISTAAEYSLQDGAANNRLDSATYQRLMLGVLAKNVLFLAAFAMATPIWTPQLALLYPGATLLSTVITGAVFVTSNSRTGEFQFPSVGVSPLPTNRPSLVYSLFFLTYLATLATCYLPPDGNPLILDTTGPTSALLIHSWAPSFLLAAVACLNLKDAADRGRLGAGTFRRLNLGLVLMEGIYSLLFLVERIQGNVAGGGVGLSNMAASIGIACYCLYQYRSAGKQVNE